MLSTLVDMEISIIEEKENPFFKRKDLKVRVRHPGGPTPAKADIVKELAAKYGVSEPQVQIDYIFSQRGLGESFVNCKILQEVPKQVEKPAEKTEPSKEEKGENSETQAGAAA